MLTKRQRDAFRYLVSRERLGLPPASLREIQEALKLSNVSGAHRLVEILESRGFIDRGPAIVSKGMGERRHRAPRGMKLLRDRVPLVRPSPQAEYFVVEKWPGRDAKLVPLRRESG